MRVVRGVNDDGRGCGKVLEAARARDRAQPFGESLSCDWPCAVAKETFDCRDCQCGVVGLVNAVQRDGYVVVGASSAADAEYLSTDRFRYAKEFESVTLNNRC